MKQDTEKVPEELFKAHVALMCLLLEHANEVFVKDWGGFIDGVISDIETGFKPNLNFTEILKEPKIINPEDNSKTDMVPFIQQKLKILPENQQKRLSKVFNFGL